MAKKEQRRSDLATAIDNLAEIPNLDERGRIQLLVDTQGRLNNGDAMEYFGHWLDAVSGLLGVDMPDPMDNPFA